MDSGELETSPSILTPRSEVYAAIDGERTYQDAKWPGAKQSVAAWITFLSEYVREAQFRVTREEGDQGGLDSVRKIAALAVCCMEENGVVKRGA